MSYPKSPNAILQLLDLFIKLDSSSLYSSFLENKPPVFLSAFMARTLKLDVYKRQD